MVLSLSTGVIAQENHGWHHHHHHGFFRQEPLREAEIVSFVRVNLPEKARDLELARSASPGLYQDELTVLTPRVGFLERMKQRNPEQFKLAVAELRRFDRSVVGTPPEDTGRARLHKLVDQVCDQSEPVAFLAIALGIGGWAWSRRRRSCER